MLQPSCIGRAVHVSEYEEIFSDDGLDRCARKVDRANARCLRIGYKKALSIGREPTRLREARALARAVLAALVTISSEEREGLCFGIEDTNLMRAGERDVDFVANGEHVPR